MNLEHATEVDVRAARIRQRFAAHLRKWRKDNHWSMQNMMNLSRAASGRARLAPAITTKVEAAALSLDAADRWHPQWGFFTGLHELSQMVSDFNNGTVMPVKVDTKLLVGRKPLSHADGRQMTFEEIVLSYYCEADLPDAPDFGRYNCLAEGRNLGLTLLEALSRSGRTALDIEELLSLLPAHVDVVTLRGAIFGRESISAEVVYDMLPDLSQALFDLTGQDIPIDGLLDICERLQEPVQAK